MTVLAGRDAELDEIDTTLRKGRSVLVTGGRGTGRSAVLAEVARRFAAEGTQLLATRSLRGDAGLPGAALQRLFAPVQTQVRVLGDPARAAFAALFDGDGPVEAGPLSAAVAHLAERPSARRRPLWLVDDLDRIDELSHYAIVESSAAPVLASAVDIRTAQDWHEVRLMPLRPAHAIELLHRMPGVENHFGKRLVLAQAAGNPLALTELSRHLEPAASLAPTSTELALSGRLRRTLAPAVGDLDPVLLRAAVLAAFAAETPGRAVRAALDRLVSADVWSWLASGGVLLPGPRRRFVHPVVRAAVIERAGLMASRDARHQLASLLPDGAAARAWHLARADPAPDESVAAHLEQAARSLSDGGRLRAAAYAYAMAAGRSPAPRNAAARRTQAAHSAHLAGELAWADRLSADAAAGRTTAPVGEPASVGLLAPLIQVAWLRGDDEARDAVRAVLGSSYPSSRPCSGRGAGRWWRTPSRTTRSSGCCTSTNVPPPPAG